MDMDFTLWGIGLAVFFLRGMGRGTEDLCYDLLPFGLMAVQMSCRIQRFATLARVGGVDFRRLAKLECRKRAQCAFLFQLFYLVRIAALWPCNKDGARGHYVGHLPFL